MEVDGRGAFDIPVTNLKGLVSRSLSDILAFVYAATGWEGVWGAQWLSEDGLGVLRGQSDGAARFTGTASMMIGMLAGSGQLPKQGRWAGLQIE